MFIRVVLAVLFLSFMSTGVWAESGKIKLEGRSMERAAAGERVRVIVGFSSPQGVASGGDLANNVQKGEKLAITYSSVLSNAFGQGFVDASGLSGIKVAKDKPTVVRKFRNVAGMALYLTRDEMEKLAVDARVTGIVTDRLMKPSLNESTVLIGAPAVWATGSDGADYAVAVLDTGSSLNHVMISGKVVGSACFSTTDAAQNAVSLCPDGTNQQIDAAAGDTCPVDDPATNGTTEGIDGCSHGTHVASTAMGGAFTLSSGTTVQGVAKGAKLVAVQVFTKFTEPADCDPDNTPPDPSTAPCILSFSSDQRSGLDYVLTNADTMKIAAVNMSLGGGKATAICDNNDIDTQQMKQLIDQLRVKGVATVIASGNESFSDGVSNPGCISTAITVGATTKQDAVASFSNSSPMVDLLAPGVAILAAYPNIGGTNYGATLSGTSMATPHVAGAFALLKSANPTATVQEIEDALKATGKPVLDGRNLLYKPRIRVDLANALLGNGGGAGIGQLAIAPADGFFSIGNPGDSNSFGSKTYTLTNNNSGSISWSVVADKAFIVLSKSGGTLAAGATDTVVVTVDASKLAGGGVGSDDGTVTFSVGTDTAIRSAGATANFLANNDFADALPLSGLEPTVNGTSIGATKENGEPNHIGGTNAGGASIWYKWIAPLSTSVKVTTAGSDFDTVLGVYTGSSVQTLTPLANNDDEDNPNNILTSLVTFSAVKGTTYYFGVDGYNGASGNVTLSVLMSGASGNDGFATATAISGAAGSVQSHTVNATAETSEPAHGGLPAAKSIWFDWVAPTDGNFNFNTDGSDFDTILAVYTGASVDALTEVASNDNQGVSGTAAAGPAFSSGASQVSFTATSGTTYHIAVDGKSGASGLVKLGWASASAALPNLVTAVLPYARSVKIGTQATAFMTVINAGTVDGTNCFISLSPGAFKGGFTYQKTDAANAAVGSPNTPATIAAGASQNFVFAITPSQVMNQQELGIQAQCDEGTSSNVTTGVNSFVLSAAEVTPPDMLAIGLTSSGDGVLSMQGTSGAAAASIATSALGGDGILKLSADDGGKGLAVSLFVCETDPATAACLANPVSELTITSVNGETRTFSVFANATGDIPFDPANNRVFVRFKDTAGVVRGATNFAVRTVAP